MSDASRSPTTAPAAARRRSSGRIGSGGVALFPADGLYGLACDPLDAAAIERIHALKGRDDGKPSAVMYFSPLAMRELLAALGPRTREALGALLPGPVTLVVANPERRYPLACREDPERLGVRLIEGPLAGAACAVFQTSANRSGEPAPRRFDDVDPAILAGVDLAIDGGELTGEPSTVVDLTGDRGRRQEPRDACATGALSSTRRSGGGSSAARASVKNSSRISLPVRARSTSATARCSVSIPLARPRARISELDDQRRSSLGSVHRARSRTATASIASRNDSN